MIRNYLLAAWRNLTRNKLFSVLNILGLAIGIVSCLFIYLYVTDELSFDKNFSKGERIYRLQSFYKFGDTEDKFGIAAFPLVPTILSEYPEVEDGTRLFVLSAQNFLKEDVVYEIENVFFADSNLFAVFDFPFLAGDPSSALMEPKSLVITRTHAERMFGDAESAVGQMLKWDDELLKVTGVIEDKGYNTHIELGAFVSMSTGPAPMRAALSANWGNNNSYSYIVLSDPEKAADFQPALDSIVANFILPQWKTFGFSGNIKLFAEPLFDVHFNDYLIYDTPKKGNKTYVYIFSIVAILILSIACFNYINLSIAAATKRTREIAVRKVNGASRGQLARQFLGEALSLAILAAVLSLVLMEILLPMFNNITGKSFETGDLFQGGFLAAELAIVLFISLVAGAYPALYVSRLDPQLILRGRQGRKGGSGLTRKVLVTTQFVLSLSLIIGTAAVFSQLSFLRENDPGFEKENKMIVSLPPGDSLQAVRVRTLIEQVSLLGEVDGAARSAHLPGSSTSRLVFKFRKKEGGTEDKPMPVMFTDSKFLDLMKMDVKEGRLFQASDFPSQPGPPGVALVNQTAVNSFGWDHPLEEKLIIPGDENQPDQEIRIIGVLEDFHVASLHEKIEPLVVLAQNPNGSAGNLVVSFKGKDAASIIAGVGNVWSEIFPSKDFEYTFLDDNLAKLYAAEANMFRVSVYFAGIAIILSCLGLYGLSAFAAQQKTREIGVRKVLGASVSQMVMMINKDFLWLVGAAIIISVPLSWWALGIWLEGFAYHISLSPLLFILPAVVVVLVTVITVSHQALKAATANPVSSLRYD